MFSYSILSRALYSPQPLSPDTRHAAVAMILSADKRILMMQRAKHEKDPWSGHMAFPGGGYETSDASLIQTAQRECQEEMGIDLAQEGVYLGALNRMNHPKICVDAFVYQVEKEPLVTINHEVEAYFWISLVDLVSEKYRGTIEHSFQGSLHTFPAIHLPHIPVPIWGISLGFLDQLFLRWRHEQ